MVMSCACLGSRHSPCSHHWCFASDKVLPIAACFYEVNWLTIEPITQHNAERMHCVLRHSRGFTRMIQHINKYCEIPLTNGHIYYNLLLTMSNKEIRNKIFFLFFYPKISNLDFLMVPQIYSITTIVTKYILICMLLFLAIFLRAKA